MGENMENHHIAIDNRERMTITQVADVDAFDESVLWANLQEGGLEITGEKLNIEKLDLDQGILVVTGELISLNYTDRRKGEKKKITERLRRK
ncbi:MAG: YabP/YqfC family sporulation protein [Firmicutes bacterium]|nr:sporulation protein [Bacillota bacterium]MDD7601177.1 YabP/YqfC family sporulation protein [Bacillota bacterium]MDY5857141.1 YabP/YqfC family sporulation protein [Anaerovoracaceae bacterium]